MLGESKASLRQGKERKESMKPKAERENDNKAVFSEMLLPVCLLVYAKEMPLKNSITSAYNSLHILKQSGYKIIVSHKILFNTLTQSLRYQQTLN